MLMLKSTASQKTLPTLGRKVCQSVVIQATHAELDSIVPCHIACSEDCWDVSGGVYLCHAISFRVTSNMQHEDVGRLMGMITLTLGK